MIQNLPYPTIARILEITDFETEEMAQAALDTLKWLDAGAPERVEGFVNPMTFTMRTFVGFDPSYGCGTACCMAGAMAIRMHPHLATANLGSGTLARMFRIKMSPAGLSDEPLFKLFYPMDNHFLIAKTPLQAAETLRRYLFTGEVVWND